MPSIDFSIVSGLPTTTLQSIARSDTMGAAETRIIGWDFTSELAIGETVSSYTVQVFNNVSPTPTASTTLQVSADSLIGNVVAAAVSGGAWNSDYIITFTAATSAGQVLPRSVLQYVGQT